MRDHERSLRLPWRAWGGGSEEETFRFPAGWEVERLDMTGWADDGVGPDYSALRRAIRERARSVDSASIAIDDATRPAPLGAVLEALVQELLSAGLRERSIDIVMALGAHGAPTPAEMRAKVGDWIAERFEVRLHDPGGPLVESGLMLGPSPLRIDGAFLAAELRIGVGTIIPNPFAGFSGGGKIVLPGLASLEALEWLHKLAMMGFGGGVGNVDGNRVRVEIDRVTAELPLHFIVACLVDERRAIREVFHGDPIRAYALGCERARAVYSTPMSGAYDVLLCNAYPKDGEFLQAENGYSPLRTGGMRYLAPAGGVVLMASCHKGRGRHGLFDEGMPLHRRPLGPKGYLRGAQAYVYAPGISESDCRVTHWEGYPHFHEWKDLIRALVEAHGEDARVGVFPNGASQLGPGGSR